MDYYNSLIVLSSCENRKHAVFDKIVWTNNGSCLVKKYISSGALRSAQFFTTDTIPHCASIEYDANGCLRIWRWYWRDGEDNRAICSFLYDAKGQISEILGSPFLNTIKSDTGALQVYIAYPPNVVSIVKVYQYLDDVLRDSFFVMPESLDSVSVAILDGCNDSYFTKKYKYALKYYVLDAQYEVVARANVRYEVFEDKFRFIELPNAKERFRVMPD